MTSAAAVDLIRTVFITTFWLTLPVLAVAFITGIVMSLAQILTSIQDSSFSTVPRLAVFMVTLVVAMPWMLSKIIAYTTGLLGNLGRFAH